MALCNICKKDKEMASVCKICFEEIAYLTHSHSDDEINSLKGRMKSIMTEIDSLRSKVNELDYEILKIRKVPIIEKYYLDEENLEE